MRALVVITLVTMLAGCGNKEPAKKGSGGTGSPEAAGDDDGRAEPDSLQPRIRDTRYSRDVGGHARHTAPLTLDDAVAAMPRLDARSLGEPGVTPAGRQIRFLYCISAPSLDDAGEVARANLESAKWTKVATRPQDGPSRSPKFTVTAEKDDLRLSVSVQRVRREGCDAHEHQFFTQVAMSRMAASAPPTPDVPALPEGGI